MQVFAKILSFFPILNKIHCAAVQTDQTDDAVTRADGEYPQLILHADILLTRLTHHQFVPYPYLHNRAAIRPFKTHRDVYYYEFVIFGMAEHYKL
jgi:hypothetical protein